MTSNLRLAKTTSNDPPHPPRHLRLHEQRTQTKDPAERDAILAELDEVEGELGEVYLRITLFPDRDQFGPHDVYRACGASYSVRLCSPNDQSALLGHERRGSFARDTLADHMLSGGRFTVDLDRHPVVR